MHVNITKALLRLLVAGLCIATSAGKAEVSYLYLQGQMPKAEKSITAYGTDLFGDKHSLFDGTWSIEHTDLELRGNSQLPIALTRRAEHSKRSSSYGASQQLADWSWSVPRIGGSYSTRVGWRVSSGSSAWGSDLRCTKFFAPPDEYPSQGLDAYPINPTAFWHGVYLEVPGSGKQEVLRRNPVYTKSPGNVQDYPLVTKEHWQISCLTQIQNGTGEGFTAISPSGVKYRFDWIASRAIDAVRIGSTNLARQEVYLYATEVRDRFGHTVRYTYNPANPSQLMRIESDDLRRIDIYYSNGKATWATDGTRTIQYGYGSYGELSTVTLPDGSQWKFGLIGLTPPGLGIRRSPDDCDDGSYDGRPEQPTGWVIHPTGARLDLFSKFVMLTRTGAPDICRVVDGMLRSDYPPFSWNLAVVEKRISHATLPTAIPTLPNTLRWLFDFSDVGRPTNCGNVTDCRVTTVTEPDGSTTRHGFGNTWMLNEGLILWVEKGWSNGTALERASYSYRPFTGQPNYPHEFGWSSVSDQGDSVGSLNLPMDSVTITRQGRSFSWTVASGASGFDDLARPTSATKSGPGGSRQENTTYEDRPDLWVMGQVKSVTSPASATAIQTNGYDALARLSSHNEFGVVKFTQTYSPVDGTLATRADGAGHAVAFSNYYRGIPQRVDYPNGAVELATVNNIGQVTSFTNAVGYTWAYSYDVGGRLSNITPPGGFLATNLSFAQMPADNFGLGAGHWRQTITKGNAETINYFDAFWRLRMSRTRDTTQEAATRKVTVKSYDGAGNLAFDSYPQRDFASANATYPGRRMLYDALGRNTRTEADSELGALTSTNEYLGGFQIRRTNPRGFATTESLWALDKPDESLIGRLDLPENVVVQVGRDAFGKATAISRGGVTRSYVYDAGQRLCKTIEPEVGATIQDYDAADNVAWRAPGQSLTNTASCDTSSAAAASKISYGYDTVNQLISTSYGDGSPGITRNYFADGKPKTVTSNGSTWQYTYNALGALSAETLSYGSAIYSFAWGYNAAGGLASLSSQTSPSWVGLVIYYAPNALGQAQQVSGFASGVSYHPNGAVAGYTLDNGVAHSLAQNVRGLPAVNADLGVVQDAYTYDANGNVVGISDQQQGIFGRSMTYDGLDRLTAAIAPNVWGTASYSYDAADNLRTANVGIRQVTLNYTDGTNRLNSLTLNGSNVPFTYDANGNIRSKGAVSYGFDLGNRMAWASSAGSYAYDGLGRRTLVQSSDGSTRLHIYSQAGQLLMSTSSGGGRPTSGTLYIHLGNKQIAEWDSTRGTQFVHTDSLGSPVAHSTSGGVTSVVRTRFEPYGSVAQGAKPGPTASLIGFTGHVQDSETDLIYMQQRYMDPIAGRFLSVDPVTTDAKTGSSFNRYVYGNNNPYKFKDPDGRFAETLWDIASLALSVNEFRNNPSIGNALGVAVDAAAVLLPGIPGGVGAIRSATSTASSAVQAVKLEKALASEAQTAKILAGKGEAIAGAGTKTEFRDAGRVAAEHGGQAKDWSKVSGGNHVAKDGTKIETHAVENKATGQIQELKTKLKDEGQK